MHESNRPPSGRPPGAIERALRLYLWLFLILSLAGWLPEVLGRLGVPWVSADFSALFHPSDTFRTDSSAFHDLTIFSDLARHLHNAQLNGTEGHFSYPPAAAFVCAFFLRCFAHPVAAYLVAFAATLFLAAFALLRSFGNTPNTRLAAVIVIATLLLGSPQIFLANRANLDWVPCALTAAAIALFTRRRYLFAAVLLGLAVAVKPFPAIFFALFLWRRRYWAAAAGLAVTFVLSLYALHVLGPTIPAAAHQLKLGGQDYFARYVLLVRTSQEFRFNHSLLDAIKLPIYFLFDHQLYDPRPITAAIPGVPLWARLDLWAHAISVLSLASLAWIVLRFRRMPLLNGIFALAIAEMLLPYSAAEYTTLLMYLPWGLLLVTIVRDVASGRSHLHASQINRLMVPCAILFTPLSFMSILAGFSKTLVLLFLFVQACLVPLPSSLFGELSESDAQPEPAATPAAST